MDAEDEDYKVEERLMICLFHDLLNLVSFPNPNY